ncbi:MAG: S8 family serine peptidase [Candidatus Freyarchaeota archaeon]|nr:S8 family serine peptidase [Candidatus Jordarchaeia archaeon]
MLNAKHVKPLSLAIMFLVLSLVFLSSPTYITQNALPENSPSEESALVDPEIIKAISLGLDPIPVIVVFTVDPEAGCATVKATSPGTVVEKVYTIIPAASMKIPSTDVFKISRLPEVRSVWLNRQVMLESRIESKGDSGAGLNANLGVDQIWDEGFNGSGVVIAILDSGIDSSHPDLDDLDDDPSTNDSKVIVNVSMVDYDPFPHDFNGHGTYVAGIVAGTGNASGGVYKGVAPGALLMNVKVFDAEGLSLYSWILSGIEWSVSHGADIILIAFSVPGLPDDPLCLAVDAATRMGVIVVAAAGDGGPAYMSIGSPGSALGAITVGAYNSSSGKTCKFSGRGPSLYMWTKPDVVATGYNVISCRARPPDLGFNISIPQFNLSGYGTPVDENYTVASTTAAAAAYVAGLSALLLQSSIYASPESIKITLLKNAADLGESPNIQGAGLVNPYASYGYLNSKGGVPLNVSGRTYTISLPPAPLIVNGTNLLSYCLVGSYGTITAMYLSNATSNFNSSHLLQGMFGVSYNGSDTIWLTTGTLLRELHISHVNETTGYEKLKSILQLDRLLVVVVFECWSNYNMSHAINAFKVTMSFINVGGESVSDLYLTFFWSPSMFLDETDPPSDDHGLFNATLETLEVNDTCDSTGQVLWLAFKGSINVIGYDVGEKNEVFSKALKGVFSNNSEYTGNLGLAASWLLSPRLEPNDSLSFTAALSFGGSQADAQNAVLEAIEAQEQLYVADLCVVNSSIPRLHQLGADYVSECMVINVGNIATNASVFFFANKSGDGSTVYYAEEFKLENLQPYVPVKLKAIWRLTSGGMYSVGWAMWKSLPLPLKYLLNSELLANIREVLQQFNITEFYMLDNYMARNVFIGSPPPDQAVLPVRIPYDPFPIRFPVDFAYYNLTVITTGILSDIKVSVEGGASKLTFISKVPKSVDRFGTVEVSINTTTPSTLSLNIPLNLPFGFFNFPNPGKYSGTIKVTLSELECQVSVSFTITYPQGRILFDSAHNLIDVKHVEELLDSTFTGYFSLYEIAQARMHELDEIPFLQEINETILGMYDVLVVCDPELTFNQAELEAIELFVRSGGCLLVMVEPDNLTLINDLLEPYGIKALSSITGNLTLTAENFISHPVTSGLSSITLYSPILFEVDESRGAFTLTKDQVFIAGATYGMGKVVVFGDSDFASLFHIEEGDNARLVSNALEWLMENRLNLTLVMSTPREGGKVYLGDRVYFLVNVTSADGGVHENLTIFAVFNLPNGTSIPMWCFHYKDGYYTTFLFTELTGQTGDYTLIIWADSPSHTSTFATLTFTVLSGPPESPPVFYYPSPAQDILLGFFTTSSILALVVGAYFVRRRRFQRKAFIPELDRELAYYMRTVINEVKAAFKELETMLSDESLDDFEKIRLIHEKLPRLKRTLTKLKTLAEIIGE